MTEEEIKKLQKIHGKNVELAEDDSEDEHLSEEQALAQAKKEGIEFVDEFRVEGNDKVYKTFEAAKKAAKSKNVIQTRTRSVS